MRTILAALALSGAIGLAGSAQAITIDGNLDAGYGPGYAVNYDSTVASHTFGAPVVGTNAIGYSIFLAADANNVYGFLKTSGPGTSAGPFSNLYFDVDAGNGANVDIGFEVTNQNVIFGGIIPATFSVFSSPDTIEFAIPAAYFRGPNPHPANRVTLRWSQSFGYSVSGEPASKSGLGVVFLPAAVPEPATWAMMLVGFLGMGSALRAGRGRKALAA